MVSKLSRINASFMRVFLKKMRDFFHFGIKKRAAEATLSMLLFFLQHLNSVIKHIQINVSVNFFCDVACW